MFDWIGNIFNNLFGKKKEEEKKPAPVSNQQNQAPQINLSPTPTNTGAGAWSAVPKPQQQPETPKLQTPNVSMNAADTNKSVLPTTQPTQQPNQPANIGYRKVQRADKGFDFYNGDQKINVDDYVKGTGANKTLMVTDMANQGDKTSQDYLKRTMPGEKTTSALDPYLNPFHEKGLFGSENQENFQRLYKKVQKPVSDALDSYNKWVDSSDKEEGFQWNDLGDYGRFAAKLPSGIAQSFLDTPLQISRATSGKRVNDDGTVSTLSDTQKGGELLNAGVNIGGLPLGGSGTLLKAIGLGVDKEAGKQVAKQGLKTIAANAAKEGLKKAGEEGLEEFVQAYADDMADDGKRNTDFKNYLEAGALGALGGGMMHGAGKGIQHGRSAMSNVINQHAQNRNSGNVNQALNPNTNQDQTLANTAANPALNQDQAVGQAASINPDTARNTAPERVESRVTERDPELPDVTSIEPRNRYETRAAIENGVVTPRTKFLSVAEKVETALNSNIPAKYGLTTSTAQNTSTALNQDQSTAQSAPQSIQGVQQPQAAQTSAPVQAGVQNTAQGYQNNVSPAYNQQAQFIQDAPAAQSVQPTSLDAGNQDLRMTPALEAAYRAGTTPGTATRADMLAVQRANNQLFGMDAPNVEFADNLRTSTGEPAMGETIDTPNGPSKIRIARDQGNVEATYFHEAVHKALNDFMTSQERTDIMMSYAADNRVDPSMTETQVEELVAEDFIQYVAARNNEKFAKPRITDQIKAVFEKVLRRIQHIVAQATHQGTITPEYRQFYNDLYSGKYADEQVIDKSIRDGATPEQLQLQDHRTNLQRAWDNTLDPQTRRAISQQIAQVNEEIRGLMRQESKAYRIDPDTGVVEIDNNILNGIPKSQHAKVIRKYLQDNLQGKSYDLNYGVDGEARVNSKTTRKFVDPDRDLAMRGQLVGDLPDILKVSKRIGSARDKKAHSFAKQGFEYRTATVKVGDSYYDVRINIGTGKNGKLLYTINGIKESSQNGLNRPFRGELSNRSISNFPQNVNRNTDTDSRYRLKTPRVSRAELDSVNADLAPYGLSATKADYNAALETVAYQSDPELFETYNTTKEVLDGILENYHNVKIRPQDAEHLYGKTWREIVPLKYIRKDALPLDTLAAEAGYDGRVEEFTDIIMKPIELHKQIRAMEEQIRGLYANENIRQQAIAVAQNDVYDHASNEVGDEELERRQEAWEVKNNNTIQEMKQTSRELSKQQQEQQEPEASVSDRQAEVEQQKFDKQRQHNERIRQADELIRRAYEEGSRHLLKDVRENVSRATGLKESDVTKAMERIAAEQKLDITGDRAFRHSNEVPTVMDANGKMRPISELVPDKALQKNLKPGVEHAIPADVSNPELRNENYRQMIYKNDDGTWGSFYEYRTKDGTWHTTGDVKIKSVHSKFIDDLADDATLNEEAKRAHEEGIGAQYIWRENDRGTNAQLVSEFDNMMTTGDKKEGIPAEKLVEYDPDVHYIDAGRVVDGRTGQILGNYVEISPKGDVTLYAGRKKYSLSQKDIDWKTIRKTKFGSGVTWTTEGMIDRITGALRSGKIKSNSIDYFKSGINKTKEALMKIMVELPRKMQREALKEQEVIGNEINKFENNFLKTLPKRVRKQAQREAVYVLEPARPPRGEKAPSYESRLESFREVYGDKAAEALDEYRSFMRALYKNLLLRQNQKRAEIGQPPILERKDYITHISEMQTDGVARSIIDGVRSAAMGDTTASGRGDLPAHLVGRTDSFKPNQRFNQFAQARFGDVKPENPFDPVREYSKTALHNIHMTDAVTMNRSLEMAARALSEAKEQFAKLGPAGMESLATQVDNIAQDAQNGRFDKEHATTLMKKLYGFQRAVGKELDGYTQFRRKLNYIAKKGTDKLTSEDLSVLKNAADSISNDLVETANDVETLQDLSKTAQGLGQFVNFVQEHANRLAGKSDAFERAWKNENVDAMSKLGRKTLRGAQKMAALSKIVGNVNSAMAQTLSITDLVGTTDTKSMMKAFKTMRDPKIMEASDAVVSRYIKDTLSKKGKFDKAMEVGGALMDVIESNTIRFEFAAKYNQGKQHGLNHNEAVKYAERFINDTVTFRDSISTPRAYNRTIWSTLLQFTREVAQQNRYRWNQMTPRQQIKTLVTTTLMYSLYEAITGNKPGSDILGVLLQTAFDFAGQGDDDRDDDEKTLEARLGRALQRVGAETVSGIPTIAGAMNVILPSKEDRKKIFGTDSSLGRYDGGVALASPIKSLLNTGESIGKALSADDDDERAGRAENAMWNVVKELPMGSQARKTGQAIAALMRGHTQKANGDIGVEIDRGNILGDVQSLLFGPNARWEVQKDKGTDNWLIAATPTNAAGAPSTVQGVKAGELSLDGLSKKDVKSLKKSIKKGDTVISDGVALTKDGEIKRSLHKQLAKAQGESDSAYKNYLLGYGLEEGTDFDPKKDAKSKSTGDETLDKMLDSKKKASSSSKATNAINMFLNKDKLKELPDWVKKRYYKESGYSEGDIKYGALASFSTDVKMDNFYRPLAEEKDHDTLLNTLRDHRKKSIYKNGYLAASNAVISQLQKEGYLSKDEAKALKALKIERDGKEVVTQTGSGNGRGGRGRSSNGVTSADISSFMKTIKNTGAVDINSLIKKYSGTSLSHGSVTSRMPNMRKMSSSRGNTKRSKSNLELRRL